MSDISISHEAQLALIKVLVRCGLIAESEAVSQWKNQCGHCPLAYFARAGMYDEPDALTVVSEALGIKLYGIDSSATSPLLLLFDQAMFSHIPLERWRAMRAVPVEVQSNGNVILAMANPLDHQATRAVEFDANCKITVALASEEKILDLLGRKSSASQALDLDSILSKAAGSYETKVNEDSARLESTVSENDVNAPPVVQLVNKILAGAIQANASDIHINPEKTELSIKVRVDGIMQPLFTVPSGLKGAVISRMKLLAGMDIAERRKPQDGRLRVKTVFGVKDLRLSTVPTVYGENLVLRILTSDITRLSFDAIGASENVQRGLKRALTGTSHVVLVTGPTGSGKTSTLYACLLRLRDGTSNIITIEDPIEYRIEGVNQIQVNTKIGVTFAEGLRSILRQDPDVIMVGEIRDYETCSIAMQAAQTGHVVLSTLHTNSAAAAITRMRDLGVPSYLIASSMGCIIAQRLVRCLCTECAVPLKGIDLSSYSVMGIKAECMRAPVGCDACGGTGFKGRTAIFSIIEVSDDLRAAIREERSEQEIEELAHRGGYRSLAEAGIDLLNDGITSLDELERVIGSLDALESEGRVRLGGQEAGPAITRPRVLLVEDDENARMVLSLVLQREMFDVIEAIDGLDALEKVYRDPPDIIVCDLMMPRMHGLELVQRLKRDPRLRGIPILMLTAADTEGNEIRSLDSGADDFVSKVSDAKVMVARVNRLLEKVWDRPA